MKKSNKPRHFAAAVLAFFGMCATVLWIEDFSGGGFESTKSAVIMLAIPIALFMAAGALYGCFGRKNTDEEQEKDESGEIHTAMTEYHETRADGWQDDHSLGGDLDNRMRNRKFLGTQTGVSGETDDYRIVIPVLVAFTLIFAAASVVLIIFVPTFGIIFAAASAVTFIAVWAKAPYAKWKAQAKKRKEK
jgi:hypothetical protein